MKLVLRESRYLKDSIGIISEMVNECKIKVTSDKLELVAMDPANVSMVVFRLFSSAFLDYEIKDEKSIGINLSSLSQVLKRAKATDVLSLELDEEQNRLLVKIKGVTNRDFSLGLLDIEESEQKIPSLKYNTRIETNNILFNEAIEDMDIVADSLYLRIKGDSFFVETEGNTSSGRVEFKIDENTDIVNSQNEELKSKYSTEYMKKIIKGAKLSNSVILQFGQDYPLTAEYRVIDRLSLIFILAPRRVTVD
jgi:proliferating cell nuclear antigen